MVCQGDASWIDDDQMCTAFHRPDDFVTDDRVCFRRIRAGNEDAIRIANFMDRVCHCAASEGLHEACNSRAVSKTGAMVQVIGPDS